ncbi:hypothetical protein [Bosea sp. CS1GBMeth4]|uniref:hypothetical protein n=1 Tax=Bosea sp. CS1GBMeth4 TaxID=1892849 RepID=UPI0016448FEB|nr:hypothetical protein [Bosea sp. CS1GBMeth4]
MTMRRQHGGEVRRVMRRTLNPRRFPTTQGFAALHDHARLPWRFFGRFTASLAAGLTCA